MADLLRVCLDAGAVGLSTSFVDIDETYRPVPSRWAAPAELDALSAVLGERDAVLQIVHEFYDTELTIARVEQLADLSLRHGITTTLSPLFHSDANNDGVVADHGRRRSRTRPRRRRVAAGADPPDRHQLHARPAQPDAAEHAGLVEGRLDRRPRREVGRRGRPATGAGRRDGLAGAGGPAAVSAPAGSWCATWCTSATTT